MWSFKRLPIFLLVLFAPVIAFAQTVVQVQPSQGAVLVAPTTVVDFGPVINGFLAALVPVVGSAAAAGLFAVAYWVASLLKKKTGIDITARIKEIESHNRGAFQSAAENEAGILIQRLGPLIAKMTHFDVNDPDIAKAIQGVVNRVPDAVKELGVTPETIAKTLEAKVGIQTGVTDAEGKPMVATAAAAPVLALSKP